MSEKLNMAARHEHANYTDGLRDLASMDHVTEAVSGVLRDCADLIDALVTTPNEGTPHHG